MTLKLSEDLETVLNNRGKFLTIGSFLEVRGWQVQIITSGRMKTPEEMKYETSMKEFKKFKILDYTIYIEKQLLSRRIINFTIPKFGNYELVITD